MFFLLYGTHGQRDFANKRHGGFFQILTAPHRRTQVFLQEENEGRDGQTNDKGDEPDHKLVRFCGSARAVRFLDDTGVVGGEGLGQLILLAFLEEEEVKGLFHLLLALHGEQIFGLVWVGGQVGADLPVGALQAAQQALLRCQLIVNTGNNGLTHGGQFHIQILHEGVLFAAVGHQTVAAQHHGVVTANLALDIAASNAGGHWKQLVSSGLIGQKIADISGEGDLVVDIGDSVFGGTAFAQVHIGYGFHIRHQVHTLVGGDVAFHITQLLFNHLQTVVDKEGGAYRNLVLVPQPVAVIDGNQHVNHIVGSVFGDVHGRDGHDVRLFCGQFHADPAFVGTCSSGNGIAGHLDGVIFLGGDEIFGASYTNRSDGRSYGILQFCRHGTTFFLSVQDEIRKGDLVFLDFHLE